MPSTTFLLWSFFLLGSAGIVYVSRKSLRDPRSHGFYRFFAWEILLAMFARNLDGWFRDPLAWYQLISWVLLIISLYLVIESLRLLRLIGQAQGPRQDPALLGLEKTSRLVTVGLYRWIRHPMYSSLLFLAWGIFMKSPGWLDLALALLCTLALVLTARAEEREDIGVFGDAYRQYMAKSRMFIPRIF